MFRKRQIVLAGVLAIAVAVGLPTPEAKAGAAGQCTYKVNYLCTVVPGRDDRHGERRTSVAYKNYARETAVEKPEKFVEFVGDYGSSPFASGNQDNVYVAFTPRPGVVHCTITTMNSVSVAVGCDYTV